MRHDLLKARDILEADHYGLDEVKQRILEYLAVQMRIRKSRVPYYASSGRPVLVRRHWVNRSRERLTTNLFAWL